MRKGKGRRRHQFGSLHMHCLSLHAAFTLQVCSPRSGDTHKKKKNLYKLCEALGVESFSYRFGESRNQEFILAAAQIPEGYFTAQKQHFRAKKIPSG